MRGSVWRSKAVFGTVEQCNPFVKRLYFV